MRISPLFVGLTAVALLSACDGGSRPSPAPTAPPASPKVGVSADVAVDAAAVFLQAAQCFRDHGHPDYPDPVQASDGRWSFPVTADRVRVPDACAEIVSRSKELSPAAPKTRPAADPTREQAFARCMREHGIADWPDPNPDGTYTIPARLSDPGTENHWKPQAAGPCKEFLADGPDIVLGAPR
jgi:hypothetical protein